MGSRPGRASGPVQMEPRAEGPSTVEPMPYVLANRIRQDIIRGKHAPGTPLREETLEAEHATSRGPIREALRLLQARGLVTHFPRRGYRVRSHTDKELIDLYRLRAKLERQAVEELATTPTETLCNELAAENAAMRDAQLTQDVEGYLLHNMQFHRLIWGRTGNGSLQRVLESVTDAAEPVRYGLLLRKLSSSQACKHHQKIIDLIGQRRFEVTGVLAELHVIEVLPLLLGFRAQASNQALAGDRVEAASAS